MKSKKAQLGIVAGTAIAASFSLAPLANAADNPFGMQKLDAGYQLAQADKKADGKCGQGKCGGSMAGDKKKDGSCGGDKKKDGSCGGDKKKDGSCGGDKKKDGSCGGKK